MIVDAADLTNEAVVELITSALVEELNIHPSNLDVSYDPETGVLTYTITSDDTDSLADVLNNMQEDGFEDALPSHVQAYEAPESMVVSVDITVDASNITNIDAAIDSVTNALQEQNDNYDVNGDGK